MVVMDYLARREHTRAELIRKLKLKGYDLDEITLALDQLQDQNLQSDYRFAVSFAEHRARNGRGPFKIKMELKQRGVPKDMSERVMSELDVNWQELAQSVWLKKFGVAPQDLKEKAQQQRFMQQRGFEWL